MFDWSHTVDTTDPDYYRWTQWIFLQLYDAGLAVQEGGAGQLVPLVQDRARQRAGRGWQVRALRHRGRATPSQQWFFRITDYAERLLDNLDWIDWSESTLTAQRNWIGRSEGADAPFPPGR